VIDIHAEFDAGSLDARLQNLHQRNGEVNQNAAALSRRTAEVLKRSGEALGRAAELTSRPTGSPATNPS
jgi:hypothetical protein